MSRAILLLPLHALMAMTGTTLPLPLPRGRTIGMGAQTIRNPVLPQDNMENVDFKEHVPNGIKNQDASVGSVNYVCVVNSMVIPTSSEA